MFGVGERKAGVCYCQYWTCLAPFASVSVVDFEQVDAGLMLAISMARWGHGEIFGQIIVL